MEANGGSEENSSDIPLSKIKRIAIELKDYNFFHSPYQRAQYDKRFIGREKKIEQFRNVLTNTVTPSGTYLVTGYRGSGKTSFVNMVLDKIALAEHWSGRTKQFLRIWIALIIMVSLIYLSNSSISYCFLFGFFFSSWYFLFYFYQLRPVYCCRKKKGLIPLKKGWSKLFRLFMHFLRAGYYIARDGNLDDTLHNLARLVFIVTQVLVLIYTIICGKQKALIDCISCQIYCTFAIVLYWLILKGLDLFHEQTRCENVNRNVWGELLFKIFFKYFIPFWLFIWLFSELKMRLKPTLIIRLNLNYDNLTERNILGLIANTLYEQYRKWRRTPFQLFLRICKILLIYLIVTIPYQMFNQEGRPLKRLNAYLGARMKKFFDATEFKMQIEATGNFKTELNQFGTKGIVEQSDKYLLKSDSTLPALIYVNLDTFYKAIRNIVSYSLHDFITINKKCSLIPLSKFAYYLYPPDFEPLLYLIFTVVIFLMRWLSKSQLVYIPGHLRVQSLLRNLDERMTAAVTIQSGAEMSVSRGFAKLFHRKGLAYPLADERTIEQGIIRVLDEISHLPLVFGHPVFIFVFDELDKITLPEEMPKTREEELYMSSFENIRRRQQQIEKILSNLKQLLTTAYAKFIFIAGREIYDAGLADFTGRSFLHSSIFNQTFYVDSFLTDHSDPEEESLTSLTESYVCQFLLPRNEAQWNKNWPRLNDYSKYLTRRFEIEPHAQELKKIIQVLWDLITYLTYRGDGSPKKITQLFEKFIRPFPFEIRPFPFEIKEDKSNDEWLIVGENHKSRYLVFSYTQQFVIGSTTRLLEPLYHTVERTARLYNDKLTTSIFMVLDHLFKFHRSAFREDFLEWMPEMLDIHRDPDLRNIIQEILELIKKTYLERVHNGLYDYRFTNRIKGEIDFASRIAELESAVFNFTLDESLEAKQFFRRQLKDQIKCYYEEKIEKRTDLPFAISKLHEIIGDLHAFDEKYDQAITEYFNALNRLDSLSKEGASDDT